MRRVLRMLGIGSIAFLVIAQLVRVERSNPPVESDFSAPPEVKARFRAACYDCHSNETVLDCLDYIVVLPTTGPYQLPWLRSYRNPSWVYGMRKLSNSA